MYNEELIKAAKERRSVTLKNGSRFEVEIRRLVFQVATEFNTTFEFDLKGLDVTVSFH